MFWLWAEWYKKIKSTDKTSKVQKRTNYELSWDKNEVQLQLND